MDKFLSAIYSIYLGRKKLKTANQYCPHKGFKAMPGGAEFERDFPKLLIEGDFSRLQAEILKMRSNLGSLSRSYKTYVSAFLDYLDKLIVDCRNGKKTAVDEVKSIIKAYHIDGVESLIKDLGGEKAFIRKAIAASYFFTADVVKSRFNEIEGLYKSNDPIPARYQGQRVKGVTCVAQCGYSKCLIDNNGNAKVREVIREKTGYDVSAGQSVVFINYKISHIWGNAQNPRYFTNLWNVVLVPAWANDLLEKTTAASASVASKFLSTVQEICLNQYAMHTLGWANINMTLPGVANPADVQHGVYDINVIGAATSPFLGPITTVNVKI